MKRKNNIFKILTSFFILSLLLSFYVNIPNDFLLTENTTYDFYNENPFLNLKSENNLIKIKNNADNFEIIGQKPGNYKLNFSFVGIPIKTSNVQVIKETLVYPSGQSCGVKILSDGILVISITNSEDGLNSIPSPAKVSGISPGDFIVEADNIKIKDTKHFKEILANSKGKEIKLKVKRDKKTFYTKIKPTKTFGNRYILGMWVRDSTAGLGTLTYYTEDKKHFAALGHSITDVDTGEIIKVKTGDLILSSILSCKKGKKGSAGELSGVFLDNAPKIGKIFTNNKFGLYGDIIDKNVIPDYKFPIPVATKNDIHLGEAKILSTIDDEGVKEFDIEIVKLNKQYKPDSKGIVLKVTDKELLKKTGGIVQGMSGSPIIQNGKLIGAITHVFLNDPKSGYGIFIENMLVN